MGERLRGKIVLDACNPYPSWDGALAEEALANGVGVTSAKYLPGTRLVRAFNAVDATVISASFAGGGDHWHANHQCRRRGVASGGATGA